MKKLLLTITLLLLLSANLFAIGFGYNIFEIRTTPEFSNGVFPTSLLYQFNFPIPGDSTTLAFRLDNGLVYRKLKQSPSDGYLYAIDPTYNSDFNAGESKEYSVQFDEWNLVFGQGLFKQSFTSEDLITFWATLDGRFENAFERLSWLSNENNISGVFYKTPTEKRFSDSTSWVGAPELIGNRSVFQLSVSFGLDLNYMQDKITRRNGIKFSSWFRYNPSWLNLFKDTTADFLLSWNKLDIAYTLFSIKQNGTRDTTYVSLVFDNSTIYRFIKGTKIPAYIQGGDIWGTANPNVEHSITNRSSLTLYGPQINSYDCYPSLTAFLDLGYSRGKLLNTTLDLKYSEVIASVGFRAEMIIFNIFDLYYEYGRVINPLFNEDEYSKHTFGFSIGV